MNEDCLKLTTYFGERDRIPDGLPSDALMNVYGAHQVQASILLRGGEGFGRLHHLHTDRLLSLSGRTPAYLAVCDLLHQRGLAGASVLLGVDGTRRGHRSRARFFGRNADVPMMVIAVGAGARITAVLPELAGVLHEPLITLERVRVCKRDGELLAAPHELPGVDEHGLALWQKLMVYTSNSATRAGQPLHLAIRPSAAGGRRRRCHVPARGLGSSRPSTAWSPARWSPRSPR